MKPEEIREIRTVLNLSLRQFATLIGLKGKNSYVTVQQWESGKRAVPSEVVRKIQSLG